MGIGDHSQLEDEMICLPFQQLECHERWEKEIILIMIYSTDDIRTLELKMDRTDIISQGEMERLREQRWWQLLNQVRVRTKMMGTTHSSQSWDKWRTTGSLTGKEINFSAVNDDWKCFFFFPWVIDDGIEGHCRVGMPTFPATEVMSKVRKRNNFDHDL